MWKGIIVSMFSHGGPLNTHSKSRCGSLWILYLKMLRPEPLQIWNWPPTPRFRNISIYTWWAFVGLKLKCKNNIYLCLFFIFYSSEVILDNISNNFVHEAMFCQVEFSHCGFTFGLKKSFRFWIFGFGLLSPCDCHLEWAFLLGQNGRFITK